MKLFRENIPPVNYVDILHPSWMTSKSTLQTQNVPTYEDIFSHLRCDTSHLSFTFLSVLSPRFCNQQVLSGQPLGHAPTINLIVIIS